MKKTSAARRVPRKVGRDSDEEDAGTGANAVSETKIKRPTALKQTRKHTVRKYDDEDEVDSQDDGPAIVRGKRKHGRSRVVAENKSKTQSGRRAAAPQLAFRVDADRPTYDQEALSALKNSTPSTSVSKELDIADRLEPLAVSTQFTSSANASRIPTEAEIREKKARRARLAQQGDYISLDAAADSSSEDASENGDDAPSDREFSHGILPRRGDNVKVDLDKYGTATSRLARDDDEDMAEAFEEGSGQLLLGKKAAREAARQKRQDMANMIASAEGGPGAASDDDNDNETADSDDTEAEQNAEYEAAQTRAGTYASRELGDNDTDDGTKTPPIITPIPELSSMLAKLRRQLEGMQKEREAKMDRLAELKGERREVGEQAAWVQAQLKATGEKYEQLSREAKIEAGGTGDEVDEDRPAARGLDNIGGMSMPTNRPDEKMADS